MNGLRTLSRPLLASTFVLAGADTLRRPGPRIATVEAAGLSNAATLVRVDAAVMVAAGATLATGRLPRLSALVLAGALVPTTAVGHAFWRAPDPVARQQQLVHFLKNAGLLGGLLLAVADRGKKPS